MEEGDDCVSVRRTFVEDGETKISNLITPETTADTDIIATTKLAQTLENKTLTTPVIASLKQSSSGGTINIPAVASGTDTLALASDIPDLTNMVSTDGTQTITGQKTLTRIYRPHSQYHICHCLRYHFTSDPID